MQFPFGTAGIRPDRMLSGAIVSAILWLSHTSYGLTLIALDSLLPPLVFLAAYFVATTLFHGFPARCLFALVLIFAPDLFSLGNLAAYPGPFPTLDQFRSLVGAAYVPPMETSYLGIYRSPEPQVSYVISFLFIGMLLRMILLGEKKITARETAALVAVQVLLMMCYALLSYPILIIEGFAALILVFAGHRQKGSLLAVLFVGSVIGAFVFARITIGTSSSILFSSRLPIITVGVILAAALTITLVTSQLRHGRYDPLLMFALAFAATPLALTNQQLLTGVMASTREWERYVDLPFVVIATGILVSRFDWRTIWQKLVPVLVIIVATFVCIISIRTYRLWLPDNLKALAIARAVAAADPTLGRDTPLVFDQPEYVPQVEVRLGRPLHALLNYGDAFRNPIPSTPDFRATPLSDLLFEYWKKTGRTPADAMQILEQEAHGKSGFYSAFLFNVCEYWYPCTDGRGVKTTKILAALPSVIELYTAFLAKHAPTNRFAFVTSKSPPDLSNGVKISEGKVASTTARVLLRY